MKVEQETEKEDLLETIRQQEKEISKLTSMMEMPAHEGADRGD